MENDSEPLSMKIGKIFNIIMNKTSAFQKLRLII